jgi:Ca-activated chloride channel family protein
LSTDKALALDAVERLQTTLGGRSSDIGATLELVGRSFGDDPDDSQPENEKIVLLVSDGYQQLGAVAPDVAVKNLRKQGFRLHTLAIGSTQLPKTSLGKSHLIYQPVDLALLQQLATFGGGQMIYARKDPSLQQLLKLLSRPKPATPQPTERKRIIPLYPYPLLLSLILLLYQLQPVSLFRREQKA